MSSSAIALLTTGRVSIRCDDDGAVDSVAAPAAPAAVANNVSTSPAARTGAGEESSALRMRPNVPGALAPRNLTRVSFWR